MRRCPSRALSTGWFAFTDTIGEANHHTATHEGKKSCVSLIATYSFRLLPPHCSLASRPAPAAEQPAVLEAFRAQIALESASGPRISPRWHHDRVFGGARRIGKTTGSTGRSGWLQPTASPSNSPVPNPGAAPGTGGPRTGPASASSRTAVTVRRSTSSRPWAVRPRGSLSMTAASGRSASHPTAAGSRSRPPTPPPTTSRSARKATATTPSKTRTSAWPIFG